MSNWKFQANNRRRGRSYKAVAVLAVGAITLTGCGDWNAGWGANDSTPPPLSAPFDQVGLIDLNQWVVSAPEWMQAPLIDGALDEGIWDGAALVDGLVVAYDGTAASHDSEYRLGYDSTALYIGGVLEAEEAATLAQIDVVLGKADATIQHAVATVEVAPTRDITTEWYSPIIPEEGDTRNSLSVASAVVADAVAGTVNIEIAIPWAELDIAAPIVGDSLQFNIVHTHNPGAAPMVSWVPIRSSRYMDRYASLVEYTTNLVDQGRWGELRLGGPIVAQPWQVDDALLAFTGFEEKRLSFTSPLAGAANYSLEWRSPQGVWIPLETPETYRNGSMVTLDFQHPAVRTDGIYQIRVVAEHGSTRRDGILSFDRESLVRAGEAAQGFEASIPAPTTSVVAAAASPEVLEVLNLIPDRNGMSFVGLPEMPELEATGQYTLAPDGQSIIAKRTGTSYPNEDYPETQSMTVLDSHGNPAEYPYYEDAEGRRYFLSAHLWYLQRKEAQTRLEDIAKTDPLGAARILYRLAETYQNYVPTTDNRWYNFPMELSGGAPFNYWGGMWNAWSVNDFVDLGALLRSYTQVRQTDAFQVLSAELGVDTEQLLVDGVFDPSLDYMLSFPSTYGNLTYPIWKGLAEFSVALGEPDHIHRAIEWAERWVESRFMTDGTWYEVTTSYHNQSYNGLIKALKAMAGYSDPAGYVSPRTGDRIDDLDFSGEFPILNKASEFAGLLAYPNGRTLPLQDTWAANKVASPTLDPGRLLLPSAGIARTTTGSGADQSQLYLEFTPKYGHNHFDPLNLVYYSNREELLPDLGYTHSKYYYWTTSTMGHNTVVVDSADMSTTGAAKSGGRIEEFVPDGGSFSVMRASQKSAYAQTSEYVREPWSITFPDSDEGYVLDLFRVAGGDRHEYTLNGHAGNAASYTTDLALEPYGERLLPSGVTAVEAADSTERGSAEGEYPGYIYVKDVQQATLAGQSQYHVTMEVPNSTSGTALEITGVLEGAGDELFLGRSPSITTTRELGKDGDQNDILENESMPKLVHRREGTDLRSTFVTVLEAHDNASLGVIEGIDRLPVDSGAPGAVAVQITYGNIVDIVLSNPAGTDVPLVAGDLTMSGEMGFIRIVEGEIQEMRLVNGTMLAKGAASVSGEGADAGELVGTHRVAAGDAENAVITDTSVSASAVGRYVMVDHPDGTARGYLIDAIEPQGAGSLITLANEDPGFTIHQDGTSELNYYPKTAWTGAHRYTIADRSELAGVPIADAAAKGAISGHVVDAIGNPVSGATVQVSGYSAASAVTDTSGEYEITQVPVGLRRVLVVDDQYNPTVSNAVQLAEGATGVLDVVLTKTKTPIVWGVLPYVAAGESLTVTASVDGDVFLVPASTPREIGAIESALLESGAVARDESANEEVTLSTDGLVHGDYRVYASDSHGNLSLGYSVQLVDTAMGVIDDTDSRILYQGSWQRIASEASLNGAAMRAQTSGEAASLVFYGSGVKIAGSMGSGSGHVNIFLDGVLVATADTYHPTSLSRHVWFDSGTIATGIHEVRIEPTGTATAPAWAQNIWLDSFEITHQELGPVVTVEGSSVRLVGDMLTVGSSESGTAYLVPEGTEGEASEIVAAAVASSSVSAGLMAILDTSGVPASRYEVLVISDNGVPSAQRIELAVIAPGAGTIEEDSPLARYAGTWREFAASAYSGGAIQRAETAGSSVEIPFYGSGVQVIGSTATTNGMANVYLDGQLVTTFDAYSPVKQNQFVLWETTGLDLGVHVIRIESTGTRHPDSTRSNVIFDAIRSTQ